MVTKMLSTSVACHAPWQVSASALRPVTVKATICWGATKVWPVMNPFMFCTKCKGQ